MRGGEFVSVRLSPEAYAHGLAPALPQEVVVPALPSRGRPPEHMAFGAPDRARGEIAYRGPVT